MKAAHKKIFKTFPVCKVYQAHIPTYPSGHWLFGFASNGLDPIDGARLKEWKKLKIKTKYYTPQLHAGAFALPAYVTEALEDVE